MKRLLILLLCFFTTDSFASGIASNSASAPCTNNTLETYSGNSNLSADWQPNEIQLRWYDNNTLLDVQSSANTCTYDGALTIPQTAPTRTGYTFDGWTVRPEMDFRNIPTDPNGTERWGIGDNNGADHCWYDTNTSSAKHVDCDSSYDFKELKQYEWKVKFDHGILYGMAGCSTTGELQAPKPGNPIINGGQYCWCKATGYKPINQSIINAPSMDLPWVFFVDRESADVCAKNCVSNCGDGTENGKRFRYFLFTPLSN